MSGTVFAALLFAALLHASWNAIVKAGRDKALTLATVVLTAGIMAAAALPFLPAPSRESWPYLAGSLLCQTVYTLLIPQIYARVEMGLAYPLMRGAAPLLVAVFGVLILGEHLPGLAYAGIAVICGAILLMAADGRASGIAGPLMALGNAVMIAAYTLIDGMGARMSGSPAAYTMWIFLLNGLAVIGWTMAAGGLRPRDFRGADWGRGAFGGVATLGSYGIALWAMTQAPVAMVAALRETAILFGALISVLLLGERAGRLRIAAAVGIALGAGLLRLA